MRLAKTDDDPDRVRPPQRGNDESRIGQGKKDGPGKGYEVA